MLKRYHPEFPSDIFLLFESICAKINVIVEKSVIKTYSIQDFLSIDTNQIVILNFSLPMHSPDEIKFESYKITVRTQNAHAYVNGSFLFKMSNISTINSARICFGGINSNFVHATKTENFLKDKDISNDNTIQETFKILLSELNPDWILPDASPIFRKYVGCGLLYKFILSILSANYINPRFISGSRKLYKDRQISNGFQSFQTNPKNYPLTLPVIKTEALVQCSGEAKYSNDLPPQPNEVYCAFVQAKLVGAKIEQIDPSIALSHPGVICFFSAKDIPGVNSFTSAGFFGLRDLEELFASNKVMYYDQPAGIIVASEKEIAIESAKKVKIIYSRETNEHLELEKHSESDKVNIPFFIKGRIYLCGQYHFTMEPHTTVCVPQEDGFKVYCSSQYMSSAQAAMAKVINVPHNNIQIEIRRIGGGYGGKFSRSNLVGCATVLASYLLNRPVKFIQTI